MLNAKLRKILTGVGSRNLETAISVANLLEKNEISMADFVSYGKAYMLEKKRKAQEANDLIANSLKLSCPVCGEPINVISIRLPKGKQNKMGWVSLVQCTKCIYESYSKMDAQKKFEQLIRLVRR